MKDTLPVRLRFGAFELDLKARDLRQGELKIALQEQSFQILQMLVEGEGRIVTRDEIQRSSLTSILYSIATGYTDRAVELLAMSDEISDDERELLTRAVVVADDDCTAQ